MAITKTEFIDRFANKYGFTKVKTAEIVDQFFETLIDCLKESGSVKLYGFGKFEVKTVKGKMGRNPKNGEEYAIPEHKKVKFCAGKILDDRIKED